MSHLLIPTHLAAKSQAPKLTANDNKEITDRLDKIIELLGKMLAPEHSPTGCPNCGNGDLTVYDYEGRQRVLCPACNHRFDELIENG